MASDSFTLIAEPREERGRASVRRLRRIEDKVPGTVYGAGKDPQAILMVHKDLAKALDNEAIFSHILTLKIGSASEKVVVKALQRHPHKPRINHIDLMRVKADEKIIMTVPIHFLNQEECEPIKSEGAVASHLISEVEIKCLPANLPESLEIDVSHLKIDESLHLSDLKLPSGVEFAHIDLSDAEHDQAIFSVHMPKVSKEDLEAEAAEAALAEEASAESAAEHDAAEGEKAEGEAENADEKADESDKPDEKEE